MHTLKFINKVNVMSQYFLSGEHGSKPGQPYSAWEINLLTFCVKFFEKNVN